VITSREKDVIILRVWHEFSLERRYIYVHIHIYTHRLYTHIAPTQTASTHVSNVYNNTQFVYYYICTLLHLYMCRVSYICTFTVSTLVIYIQAHACIPYTYLSTSEILKSSQRTAILIYISTFYQKPNLYIYILWRL